MFNLMKIEFKKNKMKSDIFGVVLANIAIFIASTISNVHVNIVNIMPIPKINSVTKISLPLQKDRRIQSIVVKIIVYNSDFPNNL